MVMDPSSRVAPLPLDRALDRASVKTDKTSTSTGDPVLDELVSMARGAGVANSSGSPNAVNFAANFLGISLPTDEAPSLYKLFKRLEDDQYPSANKALAMKFSGLNIREAYKTVYTALRCLQQGTDPKLMGQDKFDLYASLEQQTTNTGYLGKNSREFLGENESLVTISISKGEVVSKTFTAQRAIDSFKTKSKNLGTQPKDFPSKDKFPRPFTVELLSPEDLMATFSADPSSDELVSDFKPEEGPSSPITATDFSDADIFVDSTETVVAIDATIQKMFNVVRQHTEESFIEIAQFLKHNKTHTVKFPGPENGDASQHRLGSGIAKGSWDGLGAGGENASDALLRYTAEQIQKLETLFPNQVKMGYLKREDASATSLVVWGANSDNYDDMVKISGGGQASRPSGRKGGIGGKWEPGFFGISTMPSTNSLPARLGTSLQHYSSMKVIDPSPSMTFDSE